MFACFDLFNKFKFSMKNNKKPTRVQIIRVGGGQRRRGGGDDGRNECDVLKSGGEGGGGGWSGGHPGRRKRQPSSGETHAVEISRKERAELSTKPALITETCFDAHAPVGKRRGTTTAQSSSLFPPRSGAENLAVSNQLLLRQAHTCSGK